MADQWSLVTQLVRDRQRRIAGAATPTGTQGASTFEQMLGAQLGLGGQQEQEFAGSDLFADQVFGRQEGNFGLSGPGSFTQGTPTPRRMLEQLDRLTRPQAMRQMLRWLRDPDTAVAVQRELIDAGYFRNQDKPGEIIVPQWGVLDEVTQYAMNTFLADRLNNADISVSRMLDEREDEWGLEQERSREDFLTSRREELKEELESLRNSLGDQFETLELSNSDALREAMVELGREETGRIPNEETIQKIIKEVHGKQRQQFWKSPAVKRYQSLQKQWEETVAEAEKELSGVGAEGEDNVERFLKAIESVESGGNPNAVNRDSGAFGLFQFMPATWNSAARQAGVNPADRSAANQRRVARHHALTLYSQVKNWEDVAMMWYSGRSRAQLQRQGVSITRRQGGGKYPSIQDYANKVMGIFKGERSTNAGVNILGNLLEQITGISGVNRGVQAAAAGATPEQMREAFRNPDYATSATEDMTPIGELFPAPQLHVDEAETFDIGAMLRKRIIEESGPGADAHGMFGYLQQLEETILGSRYRRA